jgi:hypothetical protein
MSKYLVAYDKPLLRVRNADNRNQRRLSKRLRRIADQGTVKVARNNGTLEVYRDRDVERHTVKREAQRAAKRNGGRFLVM